MNNNSSYTITAKPIKMLELHYQMIQFLIIAIIGQHYLTISEQNFCVNKAQVYPMKVYCLIAHKLQVV